MEVQKKRMHCNLQKNSVAVRNEKSLDETIKIFDIRDESVSIYRSVISRIDEKRVCYTRTSGSVIHFNLFFP